jgi:hypothetical protein
MPSTTYLFASLQAKMLWQRLRDKQYMLSSIADVHLRRGFREMCDELIRKEFTGKLTKEKQEERDKFKEQSDELIKAMKEWETELAKFFGKGSKLKESEFDHNATLIFRELSKLSDLVKGDNKKSFDVGCCVMVERLVVDLESMKCKSKAFAESAWSLCRRFPVQPDTPSAAGSVSTSTASKPPDGEAKLGFRAVAEKLVKEIFELWKVKTKEGTEKEPGVQKLWQQSIKLDSAAKALQEAIAITGTERRFKDIQRRFGEFANRLLATNELIDAATEITQSAAQLKNELRVASKAAIASTRPLIEKLSAGESPTTAPSTRGPDLPGESLGGTTLPDPRDPRDPEVRDPKETEPGPRRGSRESRPNR